jgi:FkbM family methyltransferase
MSLSEKMLHLVSRIQFRVAVKKWFRDDGDGTLRIDYDLNEDSIVLDVGGYKGDWAAQIYDRCKCRIIIFEPVRLFYEKIHERFRDNPLITVYNFGLGAQDANLEISINGDGSSFYNKADHPHTEECKILDIEKFVMENGIEEIALIKINIEGGEYELLDKIIDSGLVKQCENMQIQFHTFIPDALSRRKSIQRKLSNTHRLTFNYTFVWENWRKK